MNNVILIYSENFKKLDFGYGHPMRGDRYSKALEEFEKLGGFKDLTLKEKQEKIKMLIRAYDPCVTCAVH